MNKDGKSVASPLGDSAPRSSEEIMHAFKKGLDFTEELLKENERLRFRVADLENSRTPNADSSLVQELIAKVNRLEEERGELTRRFTEVEQENKDFATRYVDIENENNNLLNIYVASYQLHSTLDFDEVVNIITEIVLNFVGAETFAFGLVGDENSRGFVNILASESMEANELRGIREDEGVIAEVIESGMPYFAGDMHVKEIDPSKPAICIPLQIKDDVIGLILIYRFLGQKRELGAVDHELFTLLAGHAATAIFASKLYSESKRKLNTIQGFIDLMTS